MEKHAAKDEVRKCSTDVSVIVPIGERRGFLKVMDSVRKPWKTDRSSDILLNSSRFSGFVCMRREAVRTNWPTVELKPARKALKGWEWMISIEFLSRRWLLYESLPPL